MNPQTHEEPIDNKEIKEEKKNNSRIRNIALTFWSAVAGIVVWGRLATGSTPNDKFIVDPERQQVTANFEFDHRWGSTSYDVTIRKEWDTYMWLIEKWTIKKKAIFECQGDNVENVCTTLNKEMNELNGDIDRSSEQNQENKFEQIKNVFKSWIDNLK